jgi:hypothetical protein
MFVEPPSPRRTAAAMKRVYVARGVVDANLVRRRLREAGILAVVRGELIPVAGDALPSVWVPDTDEASALAAMRRPLTISPEST